MPSDTIHFMQLLYAKGHVIKNYHARKYDVPKGIMKCIPKGSRKA